MNFSQKVVAAAMGQHNNRNAKKNASSQEATTSISPITAAFKFQMKQRIYGVSVILICAVILLLAARGTTPIERDTSPVLLLIPLGIYMIFTKKNLIYDGERGQGYGSPTGSTATQRILHQDHMGLGKVSGAFTK